MATAQSIILEFGKHKGRDTDWVWINDRAYAEWMLRQEPSGMNNFNEVRSEFLRRKIKDAIHEQEVRRAKKKSDESFAEYIKRKRAENAESQRAYYEYMRPGGDTWDNPYFKGGAQFYTFDEWERQAKQDEARQNRKQYEENQDFNWFEDDEPRGYNDFRKPRQSTSRTAWHEVLGVSMHADEKTIKTAWRKLVSKWHPDRNTDPKAAEMTQKINDAYAEAMKGR